jgi:hypothetical protein
MVEEVRCEMLDRWEAIMGTFTVFTENKEEARGALEKRGWILIRAEGGKTASGMPYLYCVASKA